MRGTDLCELEYDGRVEAVRVALFEDRIAIVRRGERSEFRVLPREIAWKTAADTHGSAGDAIVAPFPGQIAEVRVAVGDRLREGDVVVVLEAMKMLHNLEAAGTAVVAEIHCEPGSAVGSGDTLVRFEAEEASA